jgi:hypothetical protein
MRMSRATLVVGVVALAVGIAVGAWLARPETAASAQGDDMAALRARIEALEGQGGARGDASGPAYRPGSAPSRAGAKVEPLPPSPEQAAQERRIAEEKRRAALERAFAGLTAAPAKDPAPKALADAFGNPLVLESAGLPLDESVDCRSTMCLVSARFAPGADSADWTNRVLIEVAAQLPLASVINVPTPDGGLEVRIYAVRPGESLPPM